LVRNLKKSSKTKEVKQIVDTVTAIYNEKLKEEKEAQKGKGKKNTKPQLANAGKASANINSRNNNQEMINDMIGDEDDYGDEYGDEHADGRKREAEEDYDFM